MTDTHAPPTGAPFTGPQPAPMFDTGPLGSLGPITEPHPAPIFDTGPHPEPLEPLMPPALIPPAQGRVSEVVPGSYQFVKRWRFAAIVAGVWVISAAVGLGLYHWWYTSLDKTLPVFAILVYLVACMSAAILVSMVPDRPQLTALALALMAAPLASTAAAAVLHGAYFFEWITRPTIG